MANKGGSESLNDERNDIALEASWEIEALVSTLLCSISEDEGGKHFACRLLAKRVGALNSVMMSVLSDDAGRTTEEMQRVINLADWSPS